MAITIPSTEGHPRTGDLHRVLGILLGVSIGSTTEQPGTATNFVRLILGDCMTVKTLREPPFSLTDEPDSRFDLYFRNSEEKFDFRAFRQQPYDERTGRLVSQVVTILTAIISGDNESARREASWLLESLRNSAW